MKPKTLKDIGKDTRFCSKLPMFAREELKDDLRGVAREWVKAFKKSQKKDSKGDREYVKKEMVILWIKDFFNLEDEK